MTPLPLSLSRGECPNRKEIVKLLISAVANITEDDSVKIKALFGANVGNILNTVSKEARDKKKPAYLAWRRDKMHPSRDNNATRKGGRRSKKHRSRSNRH
jgi:hypothetical protein